MEQRLRSVSTLRPTLDRFCPQSGSIATSEGSRLCPPPPGPNHVSTRCTQELADKTTLQKEEYRHLRDDPLSVSRGPAAAGSADHGQVVDMNTGPLHQAIESPTHSAGLSLLASSNAIWRSTKLGTNKDDIDTQALRTSEISKSQGPATRTASPVMTARATAAWSQRLRIKKAHSLSIEEQKNFTHSEVFSLYIGKGEWFSRADRYFHHSSGTGLPQR